MNVRWAFGGVALLALLAGIAVWLGSAAPGATSAAPQVSPAALYAATFLDADGKPQPLGRYRGKILVLNFWATWCAPCRREMPAFARLQSRWAGHRVQFVGLANDDPQRVAQFGRELGIDYPLLTGGDEVSQLSEQLGDSMSVLPYTVILDRGGRVLEQKVGAYTEAALDERLSKYSLE